MGSWPRDLRTARLVLRADVGDTGDDSVAYVIDHDGTLVGAVGLAPTAEADALALTCRIDIASEQNGCATEAAQAVCALAFERVARVLAYTRPDDRAAGVARRLGFVVAATVRDDEGPIQVWVGERGPSLARAAVANACSQIRGFSIGDDGTLRVGAATIRVCAVAGQPYAIAVATIAHASSFDPLSCLAHNASLGVGAVTFVDDDVALRFSCPAHAVTAGAIELFLHEADRLRRCVCRAEPAAAASVWAAFTD